MIDYDGSYGIFTKLGLIGGFLSDINSFQKSLVNIKSPTFVSKFTGNEKTSLILDYIPSIDGQISTVSNLIPDLLLNVATNVVIDSVRTHDPLIPADLSSCMTELVRQMVLDSKTVRSMSTTVSITDSSNKNIALVAIKNRDGGENQFTLAEKVRLEVTTDSYTGGASPGNEGFTVITRDAATSAYNYDYPAGSGSTVTLSRTNITASASEGNIVENGTFTIASETTPTAPASWVAVGSYGTAGTNWKTTSEGLKIVGNASSDVRLQQEISTGVTARNVYAFHFRAKAPSALTTGTIAIDLVDSTGNILVDDSNNYLAYSVNLSTLTSSFSTFTGFFVFGTKNPDVVYLRIRCTTADTTVVIMDRLVLTEMTELYSGGPFVSVLGLASQPLTAGERIDLNFSKALATVANNAPATLTYTNNTFQVLFDRLFSTGAGGFTLPNSATPTINDSLIA